MGSRTTRSFGAVRRTRWAGRVSLGVASLGVAKDRRFRRSRLHTLPILGAACALGLFFGASSASAATPVLTIDPAVIPGYTSVAFSGEVDPQGDVIEWYDETSTDEGQTWEFGDVLGFSEDGTPQLITGAVRHGLTPGTTYRIRITAFDVSTNELLASPEPSPVFSTKSVAAPGVTLDPVTSVSGSAAVFEATIDPNSPGGLDEEGKSLFATSYEFHCDPGCPDLAGGTVPAEASGSELEVEAHATGLEPGREYKVTISAVNSGGEGADGPQTFTTLPVPPGVGVGPGSAPNPGSYTIEGTVNPHNTAITACDFEWGPTASYGHVAACDPMPGGGNEPKFVTAVLQGLTVGAEYHFRLLASNGVGLPAATPDATFLAHEPCGNEAIREAQGSTFLPECRAWELASNPYKEGFAASLKAVSPDGNRIEYVSNGNFKENGFGSSGVPGGNFYLATRDPGWLTEPLAPKGPTFNVPIFAAPLAISPDFSTSLWHFRLAGQPVGEEDFFRREPDGRFVAVGPLSDVTKLSPSAPGGPSISEPAQLSLAASADMSRFAFGSGQPWTDPGLQSSEPRLYEYRGAGAPRPTLASVDNQGHPINPGCEVRIGAGNADSAKAEHRMSEDGRVLFWSSACGFDAETEIFARFKNGTTIAVAASQCDRGTADPCLDEPIQVQYQGASSDGSVVYFTTPDQLVGGDHDSTEDLYACVIPSGEPAPAGPLNSCATLTEVSAASTQAGVQEVLAVSGDGNRVYYLAHGILASNPGANGDTAVSGQDNLYLWERDDATPLGGTDTFIATIGPNAVPSAQTTASGRFLLLSVRSALIDSGPQADTDGGASDLYRYDVGSGTLLRVSTDTDGQGGDQPGADVRVASVKPFEFPLGPVASHPAISEDGSVVFLTEEALSPFDHNASPDSYLWRDGKLSLLSSGSAYSLDPSGNSAAIEPIISSDGRDAFVTTATPLTAEDPDTTYDVYDARVEGGFRFPGSEEPCVGEEGCRTLTSTAHGPVSSASQAAGPGNPSRPKVCPRNKLKKSGRCVKRRPTKHRHHRRHSSHSHHRNAQK